MLASLWNALPRAVAGLWGWFEQPGGFWYEEGPRPLLARFCGFPSRLRHQFEVDLRHPPLERLPCLPDAGLAGSVDRFRLHARLPWLALGRGHLAPGLADLLAPLGEPDGSQLSPVS